MDRVERVRGRLVWWMPAIMLVLVTWWQMDRSLLDPTPATAQVVPEGSGQGEGTSGAGQASTGTPATELGLLLSFPFYGNTPSLAWSPDGRRLAFNAAFRAARNRDEIDALRDSLGLYVYERDGTGVRQVIKEQRYHPAWLGNERLASACSPYETCSEGLYLTGLDGSHQLVLQASVYHTLAVNDHQVLFYNGWSGDTHWNRFDIDTTTRETELSTACSWEPPPEMFVDQCVQRVGELSVLADPDRGLWVRMGGDAPVLIDTELPYVFTRHAYACERNHVGPVAPCLSPDGRQVAYVARSDQGMVLRIHGLPDSPAALSAMHLGEFPLGSVIPEQMAPCGTDSDCIID